ncbi:MAG: glycosyltransferase family 1 protein [Treponema sp.]|nr:glycosyltransferase family 1 protein [Treponema sp.]
MRIALVHYHLRRGGVSSVILNQARSLAKAGADILLIMGEDAQTEFPFAKVEDLCYNPLPQGEEGARLLAEGILRAMDNRWGEPADVIHVHNPLIQKNPLLIGALRILIERGCRLLLQNHDLAEDFRPDVYIGGEYPENCHYAVINSRDYDFLIQAGLVKEGLYLIPNEVSCLAASAGMERTRYLYPVRAIRRKNIGEALLLSLFIPKGRTVAITLPASEKDYGKYERWTNFAAALNLPVEFGIGTKMSLQDLLGSAVCAVTTSVKEGFGFSFLEPWTAGRSLAGRRIDYVCKDFENSGVRFDSLYSSLEIPKTFIDVNSVEQKMEDAMRRIYSAFGLTVPTGIIETSKNDLAKKDTIDFGRLDEELQESVIRGLCEIPQKKRQIIAHNPALEKMFDHEEDAELLEANNSAIRKQYGKERISELLMSVYQKVIDRPVSQKLSKTALLELYLDPKRLSLVGISDG